MSQLWPEVLMAIGGLLVVGGVVGLTGASLPSPRYHDDPTSGDLNGGGGLVLIALGVLVVGYAAAESGYASRSLDASHRRAHLSGQCGTRSAPAAL